MSASNALAFWRSAARNKLFLRSLAVLRITPAKLTAVYLAEETDGVHTIAHTALDTNEDFRQKGKRRRMKGEP